MTELIDSPWLFFPFFILMWCTVCFILSRLGGWSALAMFYATTNKPIGEKYAAQSIKLGYGKFMGANYGNIVTAHLSDEALFMTIMPLFRLGHARLRIPLIDVDAEASRLIFFKTVKVRFKKFDTLQMHVFGTLGRDILTLKSSAALSSLDNAT